jgi:outer membrane protein assembly factor BamD
MMLILATGCTTTQEDLDARSNLEAKYFWTEGKQALAAKDYLSAIESFEDLETRFPFGQYAQRAQLAAAYAYFKNDNPEAAISTAERFIKLYPTHQNVDYAYYIRGLAHFHSRENFLDDLFNVDSAMRNAESVKRSFLYFAELIKKFPNSKYVPDARQRMIHLRNNLARNEIYVAEYYMKRGAYLSAAKRATYVITNYSRAPSVYEALNILSSAYSKLGLDDLASDTQRIIKLNYSDSPSLNDHRKNEPVSN